MEKALPSIAHLLLRPARPKPPSDSEAASGMLAVSMVLPEQFYSRPTATDKVNGEVALMRAVLEDAINCFQKQPLKSGRRAQRPVKEAEEWLFTDDPRWPFSFVNICAVLGLDAEYLRLGLARWRQPHRAQPQKTRRRVVRVHQLLKISV